jgi:hypothetical protein
MPLKFLNDTDSLSTERVFSDIKYHNTDGDRYYSLSEPKTKSEIRVKYVPLFESPRDPERYECFLFENSYLTAENDVFEIYETSLTGRFGWIFPISALDSNENNYAEENSFKHYRHIAYQKLLSANYNVSLRHVKDEYQISEIFQGITVCILSKDEIAKLSRFKITDYVLSFLKQDYLLLNNYFRGKISFKKDNVIEELRKGNHRIKIKKAAFDITTNQFTNSLFIDHVYQTENILTKYILLYQILEQFIQEFGDSLVEEIITEYQDGKITKNTLKEKIGKLQNDRHLLKKPFERTIIKQETKQDFLQKNKFLFTDLGLIVSHNFEDAIYDLRNLVTHNYRVLTNKTDELNELIYLFELIIFDLLNNFNEKPEKTPPENTTEETVSDRKQFFKKPLENPKGIKQQAIRGWNNFLQSLVISK